MQKLFAHAKHLARVVVSWLKKRWTSQSMLSHIVDISVITVFALALPLDFFTSQTVTTIFPQELIPVVILHAIFGVLLYFLVWVLFPTPSGRLIAAVALTYMLLKNFTERYAALSPVLSLIFPEGPFELVKVIITIAVLVFFVWLVVRFIERRSVRFDQKNIHGAIRLFMLFVGGWVLIQTLYLVVRTWDTVSYGQESEAVAATKRDDAPDVYYLVYDRYPSQQSLRDYYDFDNSEFMDKLRSEGFFVREGALSNYPFTAPSVSSTLSMDYNDNLKSQFQTENVYTQLPYANIIRNSRAVNTFSQLGYDTNYMSSWWEITQSLNNAEPIYTPYEAVIFGKSYILSEYQKAILNRSFFMSFAQKGVVVAGKTIFQINIVGDDRDLFLKQHENLVAFAAQKHEKPQFVFGHILNPHPPYLFTPDGNTVGYDPGDNDGGLPRRDKMINQLRYTNTQILQLIRNIKASSKTEPIIILQADEGPYPLEMPADWSKSEPDVIRSKMGVLAAYSMPGVDETKRQDLNANVNAFRFVLNNYFDAQLQYLPDCQYVLNKEAPFDYIDVTARVKPDAAECKR